MILSLRARVCENAFRKKNALLYVYGIVMLYSFVAYYFMNVMKIYDMFKAAQGATQLQEDVIP
jgi:hypothetical protein